VTRWMSLKLLGEILLDRRNRSVMVRYVSSVDNLKVCEAGLAWSRVLCNVSWRL
jgi:hypothetical protein